MEGVLIIDKPAGMTSHDVVARVRRIFGQRRVGHTGTLDPFATGVLVVLLGRATRLSQFLSGAEKEYQAVIRLGYATDTGDLTGVRIANEVHAKAQSLQSIAKQELESALGSLTGDLEQVPPMYSAKKIAGRKLYEHARRGEEIERKPIQVTVHKFELLSNDNEFLRPNEEGSADFRVRVVCSAGTYVRTLAEALGNKLGTGAHLTELRRTRAGRFGIDTTITLDDLTARATSGTLESVIISPNQALSHLPSVELDSHQARQTVHGIDLSIDGSQADSWSEGSAVRLATGGELIAVGRFDATARVIHPAVVLGNG
jgi:tRNA pseudouridine55 synthase